MFDDYIMFYMDKTGNAMKKMKTEEKTKNRVIILFFEIAALITYYSNLHQAYDGKLINKNKVYWMIAAIVSIIILEIIAFVLCRNKKNIEYYKMIINEMKCDEKSKNRFDFLIKNNAFFINKAKESEQRINCFLGKIKTVFVGVGLGFLMSCLMLYIERIIGSDEVDFELLTSFLSVMFIWILILAYMMHLIYEAIVDIFTKKYYQFAEDLEIMIKINEGIYYEEKEDEQN